MARYIIFLCLLAFVFAEDKVDVSNAAEEEGRIVGGFYAQPGQIPYQVSIQVNNRHICGGSIINQRYILTAAHCIYNITGASNYTIVVGTNDLYGSSSTYRRYPVANITPHENYTSASINNDVGVIKTAQNITYNANVKNISTNPNFIGGGVIVRVSGWGYTSYPGLPSRYLKFLNVLTITNAQCNNTRIANIGPGSLCTAAPFFQGTCFGDSGGPLVYNGSQVGIVSWVVPCARLFPDGYTRVSSYAQWIANHTA